MSSRIDRRETTLRAAGAFSRRRFHLLHGGASCRFLLVDQKSASGVYRRVRRHGFTVITISAVPVFIVSKAREIRARSVRSLSLTASPVRFGPTGEIIRIARAFNHHNENTSELVRALLLLLLLGREGESVRSSETIESVRFDKQYKDTSSICRDRTLRVHYASFYELIFSFSP